MPRIYKGSENTLKLLVHTCDPDTIDNLKIVLFTDDPNSAAEFYSDSITIEGNIASLKVNAWSFDNMNEGVINYIASGELGNDTFLTERQSNYYLKSPNNYTPTTPDFDNYYTKTEVDDMLKDIEVDVDLEGYATEEYVNNAIANIEIPEGGSEATIVEFEAGRNKPTFEEFNLLYESAIAGKPTYVKYDGGMFIIFADYNISTERGLYHLYTEAFNAYYVYWYINNANNYLYSVKNQVFSSNGVKKTKESAVDNIRLISPSDYSVLPLYYQDYNKNLSAPMSISKDKSATFLLDGKMYYFDEVNGEKDGSWVIPKVVDLVNIGSDSSEDAGTYILEYTGAIENREWWYDPNTGQDEIIVDYNEEQYNNSEERLAHNKEVIDAILEGKVKTLFYHNMYDTFDVVVEVDGNGREHRKYEKRDEYVPFSWYIDGSNVPEDCMAFGGMTKNTYAAQDLMYTEFCLYKNTAQEKDRFIHAVPMGYKETVWYLDESNGFTMKKYMAQNVWYGGTPSFVVLNYEGGMIQKKMQLNVWNDDTKGGVAVCCIDNDAVFYKWDFGSEDNTATPIMIDLKSTDIDLSDYYTKAETDELIADINLGDSTTISSIVSTEVSNQLTDNFKTINGESILGTGNIEISGGSAYKFYSIVGRNMTPDEWTAIYNDSQSGVATYIIYDNGIKGEGFVTLGYYGGYYSIVLTTPEKQLIWSQGNITGIEAYVNEISLGGGSSSGVPDYSTITYPTLVSPIINGEMQFQEDYGPYTDTASGIACGYKMKRAVINDLWTQNLHLGNDTDDSTIKITNDAYGVNGVEGVKVVYHEFTKTGIKENGTYLSEKYAPLSVIGDINSILATI